MEPWIETYLANVAGSLQSLGAHHELSAIEQGAARLGYQQALPCLQVAQGIKASREIVASLAKWASS